MSIRYTPEGKTVGSLHFDHEVGGVIADLEILCGRKNTGEAEPTYRDFAWNAKLAAEKLIEMVHHYRNTP